MKERDKDLSTVQVGLADEYSYIMAFKDKLSKYRQVDIVRSRRLRKVKKVHEYITRGQRSISKVSAYAGVNALMRLEPYLLEGTDPITIELIYDDRPENDCRDIVISRKEIGWEIGLSLNTDIYSPKPFQVLNGMDFCLYWLGSNCTNEYWTGIKEVYKLYENGNIDNIETLVFDNVTKLIKEELLRQYEILGEEFSRRLINYFFCSHDHYKISSINNRSITIMQYFNMNGTLNKQTATSKNPYPVKPVSLPKKLASIELKPKSISTLELIFELGWKINLTVFRRKKNIEDFFNISIQLDSKPDNINSLEVRWGEL